MSDTPEAPSSDPLEHYLIASQAEGLSWGWLGDQLRQHETLAELIEAISPASDRAAQDTLHSLKRHFSDRTQQRLAAEALQDAAAQNLTVIPWHSPLYPETLRSLYRPPLVLFLRGRPPSAQPIFGELLSAIVGSRRADSSGMRIARSIALDLAASRVTIVSGLAAGIDSAAHQGALDSKRRLSTIAVLGHGHRFCYPRTNEHLLEQIVDTGGYVISEYFPRTPPLPHQFIARNRIIAGLSAHVVVVQATAKSGSLATARFALDQGKEIFVLPGSIDDPRYEGSNRLLRDGATIVTSSADIVSSFPTLTLSEQSPVTLPAGLPAELEGIVQCLRQNGPMSFDQLTDAGKGTFEASHESIIELEIAGIIERLPGNQIALARA